MNGEYLKLSEAVSWIAFRGNKPSVIQELEKSALLDRAMRILHACLCSGCVSVYGKQTPQSEMEKLTVYQHCVFDCGYNVIFYDDDIEFAKREGRYRGDIAIDATELKSFFMCSCCDCKTTLYTTPYLEIMDEVIIKLGIAKENQPTKKIIEAAIAEISQERGIVLSQNSIGSMASFVRLPESRRGGNRKMFV